MVGIPKTRRADFQWLLSCFVNLRHRGEDLASVSVYRKGILMVDRSEGRILGIFVRIGGVGT